MKATQNLIACALFTCILALPITAGDMHNPGRISDPPTVLASDSDPKAQGNSPSEGDNALDLLIQVALFFHKNIVTAM
jgi:hypothetical protein